MLAAGFCLWWQDPYAYQQAAYAPVGPMGGMGGFGPREVVVVEGGPRMGMGRGMGRGMGMGMGMGRIMCPTCANIVPAMGVCQACGYML